MFRDTLLTRKIIKQSKSKPLSKLNDLDKSFIGMRSARPVLACMNHWGVLRIKLLRQICQLEDLLALYSGAALSLQYPQKSKTTFMWTWGRGWEKLKGWSRFSQPQLSAQPTVPTLWNASSISSLMGISHLRASKPGVLVLQVLEGPGYKLHKLDSYEDSRFCEHLQQQLFDEWSELKSPVGLFVYIFHEHDRTRHRSRSSCSLARRYTLLYTGRTTDVWGGVELISFVHGGHEFQNSHGGFVYCFQY